MSMWNNGKENDYTPTNRFLSYLNLLTLNSKKGIAELADLKD